MTPPTGPDRPTRPAGAGRVRVVGRWAAYMLFLAVAWLATFALDAPVLRLPARISVLIATVTLTAFRLPAWLREASRP
jgi:hypothetical protein